MKILKLLKHDKKTYIHIKDHPDNHGYIISTVAVTLMSLQELLKNFSIESYELQFKVPTSYSSNLGIIDILIEGTMTFKEKLELLVAYNEHIGKLDNVPNIIEYIDVIDSVKPQPTIVPRDINNLPFTPNIPTTKRSIGQPFSVPDNGGWQTNPGNVGRGGWVTR